MVLPAARGDLESKRQYDISYKTLAQRWDWDPSNPHVSSVRQTAPWSCGRFPEVTMAEKLRKLFFSVVAVRGQQQRHSLSFHLCSFKTNMVNSCLLQPPVVPRAQ